MNHLRRALLAAVVLLAFTATSYADYVDNVGGGGIDANIEEGRFLGLLKKGRGQVETHTNFVPYPYPVPVVVPVYQNHGLGGKLGLGKGLDQASFGGGFGQGYYPGFPYYQYSNIGQFGYGDFGPGQGAGGYGYFK